MASKAQIAFLEKLPSCLQTRSVIVIKIAVEVELGREVVASFPTPWLLPQAFHRNCISYIVIGLLACSLIDLASGGQLKLLQGVIEIHGR